LTSELCLYNSHPFCRIACVIFTNTLLFKRPEIVQLVLQISLIFGSTYLCEKLFSFMKRKDLRNIRINRYQFVTSNESNKNINVKSEIYKLSTNIRCQFLKNIVRINEISEQNPNGRCNIDFVFTLGSNKCFLYLWHHGTFKHHEFIFIFKMYIFRPLIS
jgi:hypothetical protein